MNYKEYRAQKAVGAIDYLKAVHATKSKKVLMQLLIDTVDHDIRAAVALNPYTGVDALSRIITERDIYDAILAACIWHPNVTRKVLTSWMELPYINILPAARARLYTMQAAAGEKTRIAPDANPHSSTSWTSTSTLTSARTPMWPRVFGGDTTNAIGTQKPSDDMLATIEELAKTKGYPELLLKKMNESSYIGTSTT